jgi:hypothetical protein
MEWNFKSALPITTVREERMISTKTTKLVIIKVFGGFLKME